MTTRQTLLLITRAAGGKVESKTALQKLAYFAGLHLGATLGHRPHFYGPYSSRVDDAMSLSVAAGDLNETVERFRDWSDAGPDLARHSYSLTEEGAEKAARIEAENREEAARIRRAVETIREVVPDLNQKTLSSAAKTYLIISESESELSEDEVPELAGQLGWKLDQGEVSHTVDLLRRLNLLEVAPTQG